MSCGADDKVKVKFRMQLAELGGPAEQVPWRRTELRSCRPSILTATTSSSRDDDGFIGDRASKGAFWDVISNLRAELAKLDADPLEDEGEDISKKKLDDLLARGDPEAAAVVQGAIESFAQEFALVIRRFLKLKDWKDTERFVIGGGFRAVVLVIATRLIAPSRWR